MARLTVLYWRDIPSEVIAREGRRSQAKVMLSQRFQDAIDRAAMKGKAWKSDAYLEEWRRSDPEPCGDDLDAAATERAAALEADYGDDRLAALIAAGGREDETGS